MAWWSRCAGWSSASRRTPTSSPARPIPASRRRAPATTRPVFGVFRSAVAAAVARAERFGVIAIVDASKARHLAALRAMGLEARLAAEVALNVTMETLLESAGGARAADRRGARVRRGRALGR